MIDHKPSNNGGSINCFPYFLIRSQFANDNEYDDNCDDNHGEQHFRVFFNRRNRLVFKRR